MGDKGPGLLPGQLQFTQSEAAVVPGGMAHLLFKEGAEGADALKTDIVTDFCNRKLLTGQPLPGLLDPFFGQVPVRSLLIDAGEQTVKVVTGEAGFAGKPVKIQRFSEVFIDINLGADNFFINIGGDRHTMD